MLKVTGFLLLQLAALLFASERVRCRYRQTEALLSFCAMLEQLRGILEAEASPMPELLLTLSKRCTGVASVFIRALLGSMDALGTRSFQELWQISLRRSAVCEDACAYQELEKLGNVLGRYELSSQLEAVSACLEALRQHAEQRQRELPEVKRLTWGLSFSASMLFGIILF